MKLSMAALLLALLPLAAQAQIIKCIKPDGSIELSDRPCANGKNSRVYVRPTNEVSGAYHRRLAVQQRAQERAQYQAEVRAANGVAAQAQAEEDFKAERAYQRQLNEAYAKTQDDARRAERRRAAAAEAARQSAGAIDVNSGQFLPGVAGGVIDPRNGTFYQDTGAGYVNSRTGEFSPKQ